MTELQFAVDAPNAGPVTMIATPATAEPEAGVCSLIYAPGAGSSLRDPFGAFLAAQLPARGIEVYRFQFPYMEAQRGAPDRPPVLEATWRAVIEEARRRGARRLIVGGRSMGGRIASMVVAAGEPVEALVLFAYPLHPPGRPEQRRDGHLAQIGVPTLFLCGTRDTFGTPDELAGAAALVPRGELHLLEGADHGYKVLKASGRKEQDVWQEALAAFASFVAGLAE